MPDPQLPAVLRRLIDAAPYAGSQVQFAAHVGLELSALNRVVRGRIKASPAIVRTISSALDREEAAMVLAAYLSDLASEIIGGESRRTAKVSVRVRQHRG